MQNDRISSDMSREQLERYARDLEVRVLELETSLDERFSELAALTEIAEQGGRSRGWGGLSIGSLAWPDWQGLTRWLRRLVVFERLKKRLSEHRQVKVLKQSSLFDAQWYLAQYPDLAGRRSVRRHPERHYVRIGAAEGRDPGPQFNSQRYLSDNPDIAELGVNPLWHYIEFGQWEGRMAVPVSRPR